MVVPAKLAYNIVDGLKILNVENVYTSDKEC